ncbi:hypothetical protein ABFX02_04G195900 [Erythranthe guttata]
MSMSRQIMRNSKPDIDKENLSSFSGSKQRVRKLSLFELNGNQDKKRNKRNSISPRKESEGVATKEKKMTGRLFKSRLEKVCVKRKVPDIDAELEGLDKLSLACVGNVDSPDKVAKLDSGSRSTKKRMRVLSLNGLPCKSDTENADVAKKRKMAVIENVEPASVVDSKRDHKNEEEIVKDAFIVNEPSLLLSSVKMKIKENSTNKERNEGQVALQKKQAAKDKIYENGKDKKIYKIQKKCKKRMKKLMRKQYEEIQEFNRVWEDKISKLEIDHKLESAVIRSIFSEGMARSGKLKVLDDKFAKKMEENNLLKEAGLKNLEAEQLSAVYAEKQKASHWLDQVTAFSSSELRAIDRAPAGTSKTVCREVSDYVNPLELSNASDGRYDEDDTIGLCFDGQIVEFSEQTKDSPDVRNEADKESSEVVGTVCDETVDFVDPLELNDASNKERDKVETICDEIVDCVDPLELNDASNKGFDEGDTIDSADVLPLEQTEDEPQDQGANVAEQENGLQYNTASSTHMDTCTILLSETELENRDAHDLESQTTSHNEVAPLDLIDTVTTPEDRDAPVLEEDQATLRDEITNPPLVDTEGAVNELQDLGANVVEKQNDLQYEVATSETIDTSTVMQSNTELQERDAPAADSQSTSQIEAAPLDLINTVNPEPSIILDEDQETLHNEATNSTLVEPVIRLQFNVVAQVNEVVPHESASRPIEKVEIRTDHDEAGSLSTVSHEASIEPHAPHCFLLECTVTESQSTSQIESAPLDQIVEDQETLHNEAANLALVETVIPLPSNVDAQMVLHESASRPIECFENPAHHFEEGSLSTVSHEASIEAPPSLHENIATSTFDILNREFGIDVSHLYRSNFLFDHPGQEIASLNSSSLIPNSLDNELEKICKENEQLENSHKEMTLQMKSDCQNEIKETIAQILKKYEVKHQNSVSEFRSKKNELEKNHKMVLMNKRLAEAFRTNCLDFSCFDHRGIIHQGVPYSYMQYHQVSPPTGVSPNMQIQSQTVQPMQHSSPPHSSVQIQGQTVQQMQHLSLPHSSVQLPSQTVQPMQHSSPTHSSMQLPSQTVQPMQHSSPRHSSMQIQGQTVQPMQHSSLPHSSTQLPSQTVQPMQHSSQRHSSMQIPSQTVQPMQHSSLPRSSMQIPSQTLEPMQHSSMQHSSLQHSSMQSQTVQPMQHSSLPHSTQNIAPHHQFTFRSAVAAAAPPQVPLPTLPVRTLNYPPQQHLPTPHAPSTSRYMAPHLRVPHPQWNQFVAAPDQRTRVAGNRFFSCMGNVQGNRAVDAVCLSDDD